MIGRLLAGLGTIAVLGLTLYPSHHQAAASASTPLTCLACGAAGGADITHNVLLFLPLGVGLGLAGWSWRRAVAVAALLSFSVEALQYFVVTGRDASLGDLLSNTAGGALGAALAPWIGRIVCPAPASARRLLTGGAAAWLGLLALSGWLQQPGASNGVLVSTWAGHSARPNPFRGTVRSAALNGVAMPPDGAPPDSSRIRDLFEQGEVELAVQVISGPRTELGWVYMILAGQSTQLAFNQQLLRATLSVPVRGLRYKLRPPTLSLRGAFPRKAGEPVALEGGRRGNRIWLTASYAGKRRAAELVLSPAHGWALLDPFNFTLGPAVRVVTAGLIALLIVPLGYWSSAVGRPRWALPVLGLAVVAGLGIVPALGGYPPGHWSEWLAGALAAAAGWVLHRLAAYLEPQCGSPSASVSSSS
ncbi:MAG: VanZ family protein [Gemmatimonadales bacterium]|nr:VanZ family protein [Gemmatimonadales bacterium]